MKTWLTSTAAIAVVATASALAIAAELKSGLEVGAQPPAFDVKDATGPLAGETLCYRCRYGGSPVVTIFTRKIDDNVTKLITKVDEQITKNSDKKMKAFVVLLTDDPDAAEPMLKKVAEKNKIKNVPLTIFDGPKGPTDYELSDSADLTVLMWVKSDVKVNHAFAPGKFDAKAIDAVVKDTQKILN
jgi:hypothetical protein